MYEDPDVLTTAGTFDETTQPMAITSSALQCEKNMKQSKAQKLKRITMLSVMPKLDASLYLSNLSFSSCSCDVLFPGNSESSRKTACVVNCRISHGVAIMTQTKSCYQQLLDSRVFLRLVASQSKYLPGHVICSLCIMLLGMKTQHLP